MEILSQFGFDIKLFAAQIVNFLVIAFVFKKFLYKPILKTLKERNQKIEKGLKDAENAALALEKAEEKKDEILKKAALEAERIVEEAKHQAEATKDEMLNETKKELAHMMEQTKEQIEYERENIKKEARDTALEISRLVLDNTIGQLFDETQKDTIMKKGIQQIKNDSKSKN